MMKIAMISGNPYGPDYGGVLIHVNYLLNHLATYKDLQLFHISFGDNNTVEKNQNVTHITLKRMTKAKELFPIELIYDSYRLIKEIKKIDPDLVHIQSTIPLFSLFGLLTKNAYNELLTLHGYIREEYKTHRGFKKIINLFFGVPLERIVLEKIQTIISLTPQMKKLIQDKSKSKIVIIPNGIDLEHIKQIKPRNDINAPSIFYLGMLTKGKGISDLINAIELAQKDVTDLTLYIGGTGPYETQLRELVRKSNLQEHVHFLGFLDETKKFTYMKAIDIFILPSHWESFPIVLLEALACGKPIITTDIGGTSYAVTHGENGFLYKPREFNQLVKHMKELLLNNQLRETMKEQNLKKSIDFDWKRIALKTKNLYNEILK